MKFDDCKDVTKIYGVKLKFIFKDEVWVVIFLKDEIWVVIFEIS